ncbi:hypothetical protein L2E82_10375 [Cichorium intybus]|uniref:Uncharacterized protein n=1 Tax=Cichorium intybus TaxID=13427 RepID=A0ACB9GAD7_CICIN|nr:hypothetical protein L2E82_10375 [Cichorium intybus]
MRMAYRIHEHNNVRNAQDLEKTKTKSDLKRSHHLCPLSFSPLPNIHLLRSPSHCRFATASRRRRRSTPEFLLLRSSILPSNRKFRNHSYGFLYCEYAIKCWNN